VGVNEAWVNGQAFALYDFRVWRNSQIFANGFNDAVSYQHRRPLQNSTITDKDAGIDDSISVWQRRQLGCGKTNHCDSQKRDNQKPNPSLSHPSHHLRF
jgi:hypothetical protein